MKKEKLAQSLINAVFVFMGVGVGFVLLDLVFGAENVTNALATLFI